MAFYIEAKRNSSDAYHRLETFSDEFRAIEHVENTLKDFTVDNSNKAIRPKSVIRKYTKGDKSVRIVNELEKEIEVGKLTTRKHRGNN